MTTRSISNQVGIIKKVTKKASSSKEAAIAFLSQAGIISESRSADTGIAGKHRYGGFFSKKKSYSIFEGDLSKSMEVKVPYTFASKKQAAAKARALPSKQTDTRKTDAKK